MVTCVTSFPATPSLHFMLALTTTTTCMHTLQPPPLHLPLIDIHYNMHACTHSDPHLPTSFMFTSTATTAHMHCNPTSPPLMFTSLVTTACMHVLTVPPTSPPQLTCIHFDGHHSTSTHPCPVTPTSPPLSSSHQWPPQHAHTATPPPYLSLTFTSTATTACTHGNPHFPISLSCSRWWPPQHTCMQARIMSPTSPPLAWALTATTAWRMHSLHPPPQPHSCSSRWPPQYIHPPTHWPPPLLSSCQWLPQHTCTTAPTSPPLSRIHSLQHAHMHTHWSPPHLSCVDVHHSTYTCSAAMVTGDNRYRPSTTSLRSTTAPCTHGNGEHHHPHSPESWQWRRLVQLLLLCYPQRVDSCTTPAPQMMTIMHKYNLYLLIDAIVFYW